MNNMPEISKGPEYRITPERITELKPNEIFVFGSNESGLHLGGAARAAQKWGAQMGNPEGLQGQTYALPTVLPQIAGPLPYEVIRVYVERFIQVARNHPELNFLVTPVGCGLAGLDANEIAPMFGPCLDMENVWLPELFLDILNG